MAANVGFAGVSFRWFVGQVPPNQNQTSKKANWKDAWGERVKIRIPGIHDSCEVTDDNLPWAIVARPTSQGNYSSGSSGIYGGEWVIGFFLDEFNQVPIITQVLGKNDDLFKISTSSKGCTNFASVNRYNSGVKANGNQTQTGSKPNNWEGNKISQTAFNAAKNGVSFI